MIDGPHMKLLAGTSHPDLAQGIAESLGVSLSPVKISRFEDGEIFVEIGEGLQQSPVFVIQSLSPPAHDYLVELLLLIDAARRSGAGSVVAVVPYLAYMRQDKLGVDNRQAFSSQLVCQLLSKAADGIVVVDFHVPQIRGFFSIPVYEIAAQHMIANHLRVRGLTSVVMVSPDAGGVHRVEEAMPGEESALAVIEKRRDSPDHAQAMHLLGDVAGKDCIIVDDILDTGRTMASATHLLLSHGARSVRAYVTHMLMTGACVQEIIDSGLEELVGFDSVPINIEEGLPVRQLSVRDAVADIIVKLSKEKR